MDRSSEAVESRSRGRLPSVSAHTRAVVEALFVTLLWSSSYVLIKAGLESIPALTFAGLRYAVAALALLGPFLYRGEHRAARELDARDAGGLVALGLALYAVTQGAQFLALQHLRAATVGLVLSFTPVVVALVGIPVLGERATLRQWLWMGVLLLGAAAYFHPFALPGSALAGLAVMAVGLLANALGAVLGRYVNRDGSLSPLAVTTVSMTVGSAALLGTGVALQGLPPLSPANWAIVLWLALANTAFAFTLWNRTLGTLSAAESSVINTTMLVQVAALGWLFLGESLAPLDVLGLVLVSAGVAFFQRARSA